MALQKQPSDFPAWIKETVARLSLPSSPYYAFLTKYSVIIGLVAYILVGLDESNVLGASPTVSLIIKILAGVFTGFAGAGVASVNSKKVEQLPQEEKPLLPFTDKKETQQSNSNQ